MPLRPDVVSDCNIYLQALARELGPAAAAFRLVESGAVTLHVSRAVIREVRAVLAYPTVREKAPRIDDDLVKAFLERIAYRSVYHKRVPRAFAYERDPADEPYLDLVIAASADYLVTRDNDLLALATDHSEIGNDFRRRCPGLLITDPVTFINAVGGQV